MDARDSPEQPTFRFKLTPDELRVLRRAALKGSTRTPLPSPWLGPLYAFSALLNVLLPHNRAFGGISAAVAALYLALTLLAWKKARNVVVPAEGSLRLADAGFEGSLDGLQTAVRWSEIENARNLAAAVVIRVRRSPMLIAIPKAAIADVPALWATLEDRLVSKRGLIRSVPPRSVIYNSAC